MLRFSVLCFELGHVLSCSTKLTSDTESKVSLQRALSLRAVLSGKVESEAEHKFTCSFSVSNYIYIHYFFTLGA